ncbi:hypothetical protein CYLTODRAFT_493575 [Cylindrobasidium torrendii FP15055 ss-10]|uniref:Fe2OG dioxygenase domain-containing protein n=1 Tax=Cylindrobasidium torrendii FP15055 ss-10 TaxID=1314674 RepID=A0A0D7B119_9AGAR|nr:hypothetical protein CYLTODRAFT_493575 [Cylindrobasidium torrendii FP15055 ss-10]
MALSNSSKTPASLPGQHKHLVLGAGDVIAEGDTFLVENLLDDDLCNGVLPRLKDEVRWETMHHRGGEVPRRVAVQGIIEPDGSIPVYRHPADESPVLHPFTPTVAAIARVVSTKLNHPVNHVLIQHYRNGADFISEHSDKSIDIVRSSSIVNVSLGAQRTMFLRTKKDAGPKRAVRVPLPHNSMFVLGLKSNRIWQHGIHADNRPEKTKEAEARGERISLTFRWIGTYLSEDSRLIWGQGATGKTKAEAKSVINGVLDETQALIDAFGKENSQSNFDWDEVYGEGSDVLHFQPNT